MTKAIIAISGMHCTSCALNIDFSLEDIPGVTESATNYAKQFTTVVFDPSKASTDTMISEIKKLGYDAVVQTQTES